MGISKTELFERFFLDEFYWVLHKYNDMHRYEKDDEKTTEVDGDTFFSSLGF